MLSNRSLPSSTLLAVLWQVCHVWITYRMCSGSVLTMDKLSRKYQKSTWHDSGSLMTYHAWNTHERACRVVLATDRPHYMWNYLSCTTESCATDRYCWKPSSLLSNMHFRNTTKNCSTSSLLLTLFIFTFEPFLKL